MTCTTAGRGLPGLADQLDALLLPLARGVAGSYRRYDWHAARFAETVPVEPVELLILEGVGSGSLRHASLVTTLAWVSAPPSLRVRRGIERDGEAVEPLWRQWMVDEAEHFARERTRERADILVDGTGASARRTLGWPSWLRRVGNSTNSRRAATALS